MLIASDTNDRIPDISRTQIDLLVGALATFWSGGKDSCLARHQARLSGYDCAALVNICGTDGTVRLHGVDGRLILIDQTRLPTELMEIECADVDDVVEAILANLKARMEA